MLQTKEQVNDLADIYSKDYFDQIELAVKQVLNDKYYNMLPVLTYVHFKAENGTLTIEATDRHRGFTYEAYLTNLNAKFDKLISASSIKQYKNKKVNKLDIIDTDTFKCGYPNFKALLANGNRENMLSFKPAELLPALKGFKQATNFISKEELFFKNRKIINLGLSVDKKAEEKNEHKTGVLNISNSFNKTLNIKFKCLASLKNDSSYSINCNIEYLIDALNSFNKNDNINMFFDNKSENSFFTLSNGRRDKFCIISPIKVYFANNN